MFEVFDSTYFPSAEGTPTIGAHAWIPQRCLDVPGYPDFMRRFAGASFARGLYRVADEATGRSLQEAAVAAFPEFGHRAVVFSYDWLGRAFALDFARVGPAGPLVLQLSVGAGEGVEIPASFIEFHESELVEYADDALSTSYFDEWMELASSHPLGPQECAGYDAPLFLGGVDDVENLSVQNLDVYWHFNGQLRVQTLGLPEGAAVRRIEPS